MSAVMVALSAALSMVKIFEMPLGGSVTLLSMLPVCMLAIMYGCKWGLFCSFVYALSQLLLGIGAVLGWGLTPAALAGCIAFDYIIAFTVLGFAGLFRKHGVPGYILGISLALVMRLVSHVISGVIFFASWAPEGWNPFIYSVSYNGLYMLPEMAFTIIGAVFLLKEPHTSPRSRPWSLSPKERIPTGRKRMKWSGKRTRCRPRISRSSHWRTGPPTPEK